MKWNEALFKAISSKELPNHSKLSAVFSLREFHASKKLLPVVLVTSLLVLALFWQPAGKISSSVDSLFSLSKSADFRPDILNFRFNSEDVYVLIANPLSDYVMIEKVTLYGCSKISEDAITTPLDENTPQ
mgnify:CR=1 FL=1